MKFVYGNIHFSRTTCTCFILTTSSDDKHKFLPVISEWSSPLSYTLVFYVCINNLGFSLMTWQWHSMLSLALIPCLSYFLLALFLHGPVKRHLSQSDICLLFYYWPNLLPLVSMFLLSCHPRTASLLEHTNREFWSAGLYINPKYFLSTAHAK